MIRADESKTQEKSCLTGNTNPSTQGSGCKVSRLIPMTLMIVLIADTPSHPVLRATLAGCKNQIYQHYLFSRLVFKFVVMSSMVIQEFIPDTSATH